MTVHPARRLGPRAAAGVAAAALVVLATPATASAADATTAPTTTTTTTTTTTGTVKPLLDCYMDAGNGDYTAILGYTNSGSTTRSIPVGSANTFSPTKYNGPQTTTFQPGTHHATFSVKVYSADIAAGITYTLDGTTLNYAAAAYASGICAPGTSLPAEGNGTGWTIALAGAGLVAGAAAWRARRRSVRASATAAGTV
ncbi:hypothetical protein [Modestobacter sp. NPDC049651]|uniref:hypothetical protein n=1 Tax=unclassified Modestobacter TaxID=2643866 RepID=UPI0033CD4359